MSQRSNRRYERYELEDSIWVQNPTQAELAKLLGTRKDRLEALVRDKETYIRRRTQDINGKVRNLTLPIGPLRSIHLRLKFHLNKIKQPTYLFSPRKGRGQRDNAAQHVASHQVLKMDIRQFYPRTTQEDIWRWAFYGVGMRNDVAGLFTKLVAIDGRMPFGSPISPVLTSLVHRPMFDAVWQVCERRGLKMSLWVDDLTISGSEICGDVIDEVRSLIRLGGFETHKIEKLQVARPTVITGVPITKGRVMAPRSHHDRLKNGYDALKAARTDPDRAQCMDELLSLLGTYRYYVGPSTPEGRRTADRMHALKQRRSKLKITAVTEPEAMLLIVSYDDEPSGSLPWEDETSAKAAAGS